MFRLFSSTLTHEFSETSKRMGVDIDFSQCWKSCPPQLCIACHTTLHYLASIRVTRCFDHWLTVLSYTWLDTSHITKYKWVCCSTDHFLEWKSTKKFLLPNFFKQSTKQIILAQWIYWIFWEGGEWFSWFSVRLSHSRYLLLVSITADHYFKLSCYCLIFSISHYVLCIILSL